MSLFSDGMDFLGGIAGAVFVAPFTGGLGAAAGFAGGALLMQKIQNVAEGASTPQPLQPSLPLQISPIPSLPSTPSTSPTTPKSPSGNQGLAAKAAAADAQLLTDYNNVMAQLETNQVSVSSVHSEATAANTAVQDLLSAISSETAEVNSTTNATKIAQLQAMISQQHGEILTIIQDQDKLADALAQQANQLAQQYASVANGSQPSSDPSSPSSGPSSNSSNPSSDPSSPSSGPSSNSSNPSSDPSNPSSGPSSNSSNPSTAAEEAAMENPYSSMDSGTNSGTDSELESMLPEMMMPAMMAPAMISGLGAHQPDPESQAGTQLTSDTAPSGATPNPRDVNASGSDAAGGGGPTQPVSADAATQPASSVQSVGNAVPAGSNTDVKLPDGTTAHATSAPAATAARAALNGANPADAYKQAGVTLPPPGTPVVNPVAPGDLQPGDVGVWKDHQVMALGDNKVLMDGQVQPESSVGSSPDFLGWMRPTQPSSTQPATPAPTPASPSAAPAPPVAVTPQ